MGIRDGSSSWWDGVLMVPPVSDTTGPGRRHWQAVSDPGLQETRSRLLSAVICQPLKRQNSSSPKLPQLPGDVVSSFHRLEKNVIFLFKEYYNYYHQASGHFTPNHTMLFRVSLLPQMFKTSCLNPVFKSELGV